MDTVGTILETIANPQKPILIFDTDGNRIFRGTLKDVPWSATKHKVDHAWEGAKGYTWIRVIA